MKIKFYSVELFKTSIKSTNSIIKPCTSDHIETAHCISDIPQNFIYQKFFVGR